MKIIYIDESGISNISKHSTFAFVMVYVSDVKNVEEKILEIEKSLHIENAHWRDMSWKIRESFSKKINTLDFNTHIVVHTNPINPREALLTSIKHASLDTDIFSIIIDGSKDDKFLNVIKQFLRNNNKQIRNVKQKNDKNAPVLRIADFMAGATRAHYDNKDNLQAKNIFENIKSKIDFITIRN
jgi:hypothetical protein